MAASPVVSRISGLARACHPLPTIAVTLLALGLAVVSRTTAGQGFLIVAAVLTGQLSIGWSNDWIDAARDRAASRTDKPVAQGAVPTAVVRAAALLSLGVSVVLSVLLGWPAGAFAMVIVMCGWLYNAGAKATWLSGLMYAVAFGSLPAVATTTLPGSPLPAPWAWAAGALFGLGAHFANVLPDLTGDLLTGVRGLPHRLGARLSAFLAPALFCAACVAVIDGPRPDKSGWQWAVLVVLIAVCASGSIYGFRHPRGAWMFRVLAVAAVAVVGLFAVSGASLV